MNSSDLQTDACPSPPRNESPPPPSPAEPKKAPRENPQGNKKNSKKKQQKKSPSFEPKSNVSHTSITISHSNGVHLGHTFVINGKDKDTSKSQEEIIKTDEILKLMENKEKLDREHITYVSQHIGREWRFLGKHLRYSEGQLFQFEADHKEKGFKEIIIKMLIDWTQTQPRDATLGKLANVLWECNEKDAVDRLAKFIYQK